MSLRPFARWLFMLCFDSELRMIARRVRAYDKDARLVRADQVLGVLETLETLDLLAR